jgi:AcrR family transcriptional regulator
MGRWEPGTGERLARAALDLFAEQGYGGTTVDRIAERAGLTKTTFFRHFPGKREVLFAGQEAHHRRFVEGIAAAPATATPLEAVGAALDAATASVSRAQRTMGARLEAVVASTPELQERQAFKRAALAADLAAALRERAVPDPAASLAADLAVRAFTGAFSRWCRRGEARTLGEIARQELRELQMAMAALE